MHITVYQTYLRCIINDYYFSIKENFTHKILHISNKLRLMWDVEEVRSRTRICF